MLRSAPVSSRMPTFLPLISPSMIGRLRSRRTGHSSMRTSLQSCGAAAAAPAIAADAARTIQFFMGAFFLLQWR